ncbi:restriction endonuclease subunit S [Pseudoalteromonas sp. NFXS39]|uniref:restriction endonuclease subunit S n=1 Tax=Pseudoalteromonas sp. NFXS39 TaxID=2818437 RepID=UPI0032DEB742
MKRLLMSELCTMRKGQTINEVDLYKYKDSSDAGIPIISSSTTRNGIMGYLSPTAAKNYKTIGKPFDLSWVTNGYAGKVTLRNNHFLPTEKCGIAAIKKKYIDDVNPKWLEIYLNSVTPNHVIAKEGNGKLEVVQMKNVPVNIPSKALQNKIVAEYNKNQSIINSLLKIKKDAQQSLLKRISYRSKSFKMAEVFFITSGVRVTQEEVYRNPGKFPIVTSKTKDEGIAWYADKSWLNTFTKNDKKVIQTQECITWSKDGNAGELFYRNSPFFPNDHCGVLIPKNSSAINLKWFRFAFNKYFTQYAVAQSSQGMLYEEQMSNISVNLPVDLNGNIDIQLQEKLLTQYNKLDDIDNKINSLIKDYSF